MFCQRCGKPMLDTDKYCTFCGAERSNNIYVNSYQNNSNITNESSTLGVLSIVFAVVMPIVGLILSIVGLSIYKDPANRRNCKIALWLVLGIYGFVIVLICFLLFMIMLGL